MDDRTEAKMLAELEQAMGAGGVLVTDDVKNILLPRKEVSMETILRNADAGDLSYQRDVYHELLDREVESCISALHHRANMMRLRAEEFDKRADALGKVRNEVMASNLRTVNETEEIRDVLQQHAHIEPRKV